MVRWVQAVDYARPNLCAETATINRTEIFPAPECSPRVDPDFPIGVGSFFGLSFF